MKKDRAPNHFAAPDARAPRARVPHFLATLLALAIVGGPTFADVFYVDAAGGSDTNGGGSEADAWQTLTHCLAVVPTPGMGRFHTIHVAAGTYDAALGEVFPLVIPPRLELRGSGSDSTWIDGAGTPENLVNLVSATPDNWPGSTLEGFTLINGGADGVHIRSESYRLEAVLRDLRVRGMASAGVYGLVLDADLEAFFERVDVAQCGVGFAVASSTDGSGGDFELWDCSFSDNAPGGGMSFGASSAGVEVTTYRCRIERNAQSGIGGGASLFGVVSVHLIDTLIAANGEDGIRANGSFDSASVIFSIERCTIVDNARYGLNAFLYTPISMTGCILYGHLDDITNSTLPEIQNVEYCDIGDGDFAGQDGNFAADPMFRAAAAGDYRLSFGSPCIDTAHPAIAGEGDLMGTPRPIDGDLDTQERTDVGALEFQPLTLLQPAQVGAMLEIEVWGEAGGSTRLYVSRDPLGAPFTTVYGDLDLNRASARFWSSAPCAPGPPGIFTWQLPNVSALAGASFAVQGLTDSSVAGAGKAWTNPLVLVIQP